MKRRIFRIAVYIAAISIPVLLIIGEFSFFSKALDISFEKQARTKLDTVAKELGSSLANARILTDSITSHLSSQSFSKTNIENLMTEIVDFYPVDGLFFTIDSPAQNSYSLLYSKRHGFMDIPIENKTYKEYTHQTLARGDSWWSTPVMDGLMGERIVGCCIPFDTESGETGVVMVIYNTTHMYDRLQHMGLNRYGLPYIMDSTTLFVAHPVDETRSLVQLADDYNDAVLMTLATIYGTVRSPLKAILMAIRLLINNAAKS